MSISGSNMTLSLYKPCPPGLTGSDCATATCNSTYVAPAERVSMPASRKPCSTCTSGFTGINCNICQTSDSCSIAAAAVGAKSSASSRNPLVCHKGPRPVSTTHLQCDINQSTLKSLYPNRSIVMTMTKVVKPENTSLAGVAVWDGQPDTALSQVWLDGVLQYYCQARNCSSTNSSAPIETSNTLGSDVWTCDNLKCSCLSNTTLCTGAGGGIAMAGIVNSLSGQLSMPCDYTSSSNGSSVSAKCQFKGGQLTNYLGPSGLPLNNCQFGACVSEDQLKSFWAESTLNLDSGSSDRLSGPLIGGIAVLCAFIAALVALVAFLAFRRHRARNHPRKASGAEPPIGIRWKELDYRIKTQGKSLVGLPSKAAKSSNLQDDASASDTPKKASHQDQYLKAGILPQASPVSPQRGHILQQISGSAAPGHLVAILGPSGAGKTTLVELLASRDKRGESKGSIQATVAANDDIGQKELLSMTDQRTTGSRLLVFVDQEDRLPSHSTVQEALQFAADLSLPENISAEEKRGVVQGVITSLGLQTVANSLIGHRERRGISGGEKRRVSIGIALVARPRILVLDEPLSGLDAFNAIRVMTALRNLASKTTGGTTVILTLHQPSSSIFYSLDKVIVLNEGIVFYDGAPHDALSWCAEQGQPCPTGHNVADHLLTMAFEESTMGPFRASHASSSPVAQDNELVSVDIPGTGAGVPGAKRATTMPTTTTCFTQFVTLIHRYLQVARRDVSGPLTHLVGHLMMGLIVGGAFFQVNLTIGGFQNRIGSLYFLYMLMLFASMSAMTFVHSVRPLMLRERSDGFYSPWAWLVAHGVYDVILLRLIPGLFLEFAMYWMVGLQRSAVSFFEFLLVANIFYLDVTMYMMTLGVLFEDLSLSILTGAAYTLLNIGLGGFLLNLKTIPTALRWIQWLAPLKYALEAVTQNEIQGLEIVDQLGSLPVSTSASLIAPGLFGLTGGYHQDLLVLALAFTLGYAGILAISVWWRMRDRR